jgi:hypothetical protein
VHLETYISSVTCHRCYRKVSFLHGMSDPQRSFKPLEHCPYCRNVDSKKHMEERTE